MKQRLTLSLEVDNIVKLNEYSKVINFTKSDLVNYMISKLDVSTLHDMLNQYELDLLEAKELAMQQLDLYDL